MNALFTNLLPFKDPELRQLFAISIPPLHPPPPTHLFLQPINYNTAANLIRHSDTSNKLRKSAGFLHPSPDKNFIKNQRGTLYHYPKSTTLFWHAMQEQSVGKQKLCPANLIIGAGGGGGRRGEREGGSILGSRISTGINQDHRSAMVVPRGHVEGLLGQTWEECFYSVTVWYWQC